MLILEDFDSELEEAESVVSLVRNNLAERTEIIKALVNGGTVKEGYLFYFHVLKGNLVFHDPVKVSLSFLEDDFKIKDFEKNVEYKEEVAFCIPDVSDGVFKKEVYLSLVEDEAEESYSVLVNTEKNLFMEKTKYFAGIYGSI
jgi:hypothetical protein